MLNRSPRYLHAAGDYLQRHIRLRVSPLTPTDKDKPEPTPQEKLEEIIRLNKRIDLIRYNLNQPKDNPMNNWSLSCQLVKLLARREAVRKSLPELEVIEGNKET